LNTDSLVPYVPVSEDRKSQLENILRAGNNILKTYHEKMKISMGLSKHNRTAFLNAIAQSYVFGHDLSINGIVIPSDHVEKIALVKKVESEVVCAYANLINKVAQRWSRKEGADVALSSEDLKGEAYQASLSAISHFTEDVKFSTFLHHCIQRHMSHICRVSNGLSNFSDGTAKLKQEYFMLSAEEGSTFDSVVKKMQIGEKEIGTLQASLSTVQNMTSLDKEDKAQIQIVDDYEEPENENNILAVIKSIEMSDLERAVLNGVLNSPSTKLGIGSFSKDLINPETNKPYSRMAFSLAWKRIKKKIADAYGKAA
jgi:DNA-directed RNA polymerase specialized sigma subunit